MATIIYSKTNANKILSIQAIESISSTKYSITFYFRHGDRLANSFTQTRNVSSKLSSFISSNYRSFIIDHEDRSKDIDLRDGSMERLKRSYEQFSFMAAKYTLKSDKWISTSSICTRISIVMQKEFLVFLDRYHLAFTYARIIELYS